MLNLKRAAALAVIIIAGLLFSGNIQAEASDDGYYGQLDPFTGQRIETGDGDDGSGEISNIVWLSDNMYFDTEMRMYGYPAGNGTVYSNVADGMILRERVTIVLPQGIDAMVFMDGAQIAFEGQELSDVGSYVVRYSDNGQEKTLFGFTITGYLTNRILNYTLPDGFRILYASRDGDEISYSRKFVDMTDEGEYNISYECYLTGMSYVLSVEVDTTPPVLQLIGVDEDGKARGPVTIEGKGEDESIYVTKDDEPVSLMLTNTFTQSGRYVATITDEAGNSSVYPFTIMIYLDRNGWIFVLIFVVIIIGVIVYIRYQRTHLRIR